MPLRWSYESVIISHADHNPVSRLTNYVTREIQAFSEIPLTQKLTEYEKEKLYQLKQALAVIHGLEGQSPAQVKRKIDNIERSLKAGRFDPEPYFESVEEGSKSYTATDLYLNGKVQDLFNRAEVERQDYRQKENPPNVFFGKKRHYRFPAHSEKPLVSFEVETLRLNLIAMATFIVVAFIALHISLRRKLNKV